MSPATPASDGITCLRTGASRKSRVSGASEGLTTTRPLTLGPCVCASRNARQAPMERPVTKTRSHSPLSSVKALSAAPYQSCHPVCARSCQVVPCPGRSGAHTVRPAAARYSAHGRTVRGLPVKPWQTSTPTDPPSAANGSAPGWTETAKPGADDAGDMPRIVACRAGAAQQEVGYMTAFITLGDTPLPYG